LAKVKRPFHGFKISFSFLIRFLRQIKTWLKKMRWDAKLEEEKGGELNTFHKLSIKHKNKLDFFSLFNTKW
jgi:hypothetical protein